MHRPRPHGPKLVSSPKLADRPRRPGTAAITALVSLSLLVACSSGGGEETPAPSGPSGALGVVTVEAATTVVRGLCAMSSAYADDIEEANSVFYDRVHDDLRVIVAAVELKHPTLATALLQARERVEVDLANIEVPEGFVDDVLALLSATRDALEAIGLPRPGCA